MVSLDAIGKGKARAPVELTPNSVLLVTNLTSHDLKPLPVDEVVSFEHVEIPSFRHHESLGRVRSIPEEADLSDEAYLRRHRFPEVLEKRSKRRERERLVHERFKLKGVIERLRSSDRISDLISLGSLPAGADRAKEQERMRLELLAEHEETLKRYDELLEPREGTLPSKRSRKPPAVRDAPASAAPSSKRAKQQEHLVITISRDPDGLRASSRTALLPKKTASPRENLYSSSFVYLSDDEALPVKPKRDISESFFDSQAQRDAALNTKTRHSGRTMWAWGCLAPTAQMGEVRDFDVTGAVLAGNLGR